MFAKTILKPIKLNQNVGESVSNSNSELQHEVMGDIEVKMKLLLIHQTVDVIMFRRITNSGMNKGINLHKELAIHFSASKC